MNGQGAAAIAKDANRKPALIELKDVKLTYSSASGGLEILHGLNLRMDAGETVSVVGPSGSGKSSMMMLLAGLERASSGEVLVEGQSLGALSEDELSRFRRGRIGIVFQDFHLVPTMTALENVAIPLELAGDSSAFEAAAKALTRVGLGERLDHYPAQLSGGEQQRVALARAFVTRPLLLLADEPTGNLDSETGETVMELLFELRREAGTTLLLITHDPNLAKRCDRQVQLRDGLIEKDESNPNTGSSQTPDSASIPASAGGL
ncbi:ABC transporter ATP-binding protein [Rhodovibrionaceae bacterium A322]